MEVGIDLFWVSPRFRGARPEAVSRGDVQVGGDRHLGPLGAEIDAALHVRPLRSSPRSGVTGWLTGEAGHASRVGRVELGRRSVDLVCPGGGDLRAVGFWVAGKVEKGVRLQGKDVVFRLGVAFDTEVCLNHGAAPIGSTGSIRRRCR
jgi:hypothetical protein